jgi:hypothetical protein
MKLSANALSVLALLGLSAPSSDSKTSARSSSMDQSD